MRAAILQLLFAGCAHSGHPRPLDSAKLDAFAKDAMQRLRVPGAAIAVVEGDRVVYERTLGVRELGRSEPVTAQSLFLMGSVTKPMTTLMEAVLVDTGRVHWDSAVAVLLPGFAVGDPALTHSLRLWQMSCGCTGMPASGVDGLFDWDGISPEQRLAELRSVKPTATFGTKFQYSNEMVAAGGYVAAHVFDPAATLTNAYARAMQRLVFDPIGMRSTLDFAVVATRDHAMPHALAYDDTTQVLPLDIERAVSPIAPAGAVWSSIRDMERYAMTELFGGVAPGGWRVVSEQAMRERSTLRIHTGRDAGYGLGMGMGIIDGQRVLDHDGGSFGFGTTLYLIPDRRIAIVILTNVRNGSDDEQLPFNAAVRRRVVEMLFADVRPQAQEDLERYAARRKAKIAPHASEMSLRRIAGTYRNETLGRITIRVDGGVAVLDAGEWHSRIDLEPDGRLVVLDPPFVAEGSFVVDQGALVVAGTSYRFVRE